MRLLKDYYECLACIKSKQTRMIKIKNSKGTYVRIEFNSATKSKETRNKILGGETFWHEIIYKSLIPTFGKPTEVSQK